MYDCSLSPEANSDPDIAWIDTVTSLKKNKFSNIQQKLTFSPISISVGILYFDARVYGVILSLSKWPTVNFPVVLCSWPTYDENEILLYMSISCLRCQSDIHLCFFFKLLLFVSPDYKPVVQLKMWCSPQPPPFTWCIAKGCVKVVPCECSIVCIRTSICGWHVYWYLQKWVVCMHRVSKGFWAQGCVRVLFLQMSHWALIRYFPTTGGEHRFNYTFSRKMEVHLIAR